MSVEVTVRFPPNLKFHYVLRDDQVADRMVSGQWLDKQFVDLGAEPLRPSGKVLIADKVLAVAQAAGPGLFRDDSAWGHDFAKYAIGALGRGAISVDVDAMTITY